MIQRATPGGAGTAPHNRLSDQDLALITPTRSPRREVQVGIFVLAGIICVLVALFMLTDPGTFRGRYYVSTAMEDAGGIRKRDPVQLRGVNIGRVHDLQITGGGVVMSLELNGEYDVPADSKVRLEAQGLLGEMVAVIVPGRSSEKLEGGDVLAAEGAASGLAGTAEVLGTKADTLLERAQALLAPENVAAVGTSAQELQVLLGQLSQLAAEQRRELAGISSSLRRSAEGVESAATRPELARAIARTDSLTARLDAATGQLGQASSSLAVVLGRIERGEGTLGKLTTDEALYDNLATAASNMAQLSQDIRENPKKYLSVSVF
jgi:phospholipid/cholesterol/gamma-HCH transport system substrate-binding protein